MTSPMQPNEYELMYKLEDQLWWYRGMRAITQAVLDSGYARDGRLRILDAGCGTGGALEFLSEYGAVLPIDLHHYALRLARQRRAAPWTCGSLAALPLPAGHFDLVTSFDVLVMLPAQLEAAALAEMARVLVPGGRLLVRVAANDWLRGAHDRAWQVVRRYSPGGLRARLEQAGLAVEAINYANSWLFPLAAIKRLGEGLGPKGNHSELSIPFGPFDKLFGAILASEARWVAKGRLPFGLSLVAVARKPE
jgi:SAM-dependent methyltransferase